jgi:serine/threonine protein kinase
VSYYGTAKDDFKIYFLYEYIKGEDLYKIVSNYGLKSEQLVKFYFIQILNAIKYLHSLSIPHRDIKPDNVIITSDGTKIKIIDFGSSCILNDLTNEKKYEEIIKKEKSQKKIFKYFIGTPGFIAPECIHNKFADTRSDYWSLGCLLYNLLTGFPPFLGENTFDKLEKASDGKFIYPNDILSEDAIDLINKLIVVDADKRLNIDQILSHPFLKKEYEDKNFLNKIPSVSKEDEEFYNIRVNLVKKYEKVKKISEDLNMIKENENMDDELKRNDEEMLNLIKNKDNLQKDYDNYLKNFTDEINKMKKDENEKNKLFNNRLNFLEIKIKNDLFNIKYYGYVEEKNESDDGSSSSSSSEKEEENN